MGLDMYLRASEYVSRNDWGRDENGDILDTPNEAFKAIVEAFELEDVPESARFITIFLISQFWPTIIIEELPFVIEALPVFCVRIEL